MEEIKIGNQIWVTENLKVEKFRNGDSIPQAKTDEEWEYAGDNNQPAWCYYDNDPANDIKYGKLYNWHAVNDPRGLAPIGWQIPTDDEWSDLIEHLGEHPAAKLKSKNYWEIDSSEEEVDFNQSGFSAFPGGYRTLEIEDFKFLNKAGLWWSASRGDDNKAFYRSILSNFNVILKLSGNLGKGLSVRCIKNQLGEKDIDSILSKVEKSKTSEVDLSNGEDLQNFSNFLKKITSNQNDIFEITD